MKRIRLLLAAWVVRRCFQGSRVLDLYLLALPWAMDTLAAGAHEAAVRSRGGAR